MPESNDNAVPEKEIKLVPEVEVPQITLSSLASGAVDQLFALELKKVLENIVDPNTDIKTVRKITIEVLFSPYGDKSGATIGIICKPAKLGSIEPVVSHLSVYRNKTGKLSAREPNDDNQLIFDYNEEN